MTRLPLDPPPSPRALRAMAARKGVRPCTCPTCIAHRLSNSTEKPPPCPRVARSRRQAGTPRIVAGVTVTDIPSPRSCTYVIDGIPRSGKNSTRQAVNRRTGRRFTLKSKAATAWLADATRQLVEQHGRRRKFTGPLRVHVECYQRADVCDGDNMQSLAWDALKGIVIEDDKQFVKWSGGKQVDRVRPRVEITVEAA